MSQERVSSNENKLSLPNRGEITFSQEKGSSNENKGPL